MFFDFGGKGGLCPARVLTRCREPIRFFVILPLMIMGLMLGCQKPTETALTGDEYPHPGLPSAGSTTTVTAAVVKSAAKQISLTDDTVLTVSNTKVTIPAGAVAVEAMASLSSYGGTFLNTTSITLQSEPVLLVITGADGKDLSRTKLHKDVIVEIESTKRAAPTKLAMLFHEDGGLSDAKTTGMSQDILAPMLAATSSGTYKATFNIRPTRIAMVLAQTGGSLPPGYEDFKRPPIEVTDLSGVANSPADVTLSWKSDDKRNKGFAVVYAKASSVSAVCTTSNLITADFDETTKVYSYKVTGLDDDSQYTFKLCSSSFRDPVDLSSGQSVSVTTPKRALAVLSNTPPDPTNATALNVTVSGANLTFYRHAVLSGVTNCSTATYSAWTPVATPITNALSGNGARLLCVLGRIDVTNDQLVPTTYAFTLDQTPPVFGTIAMVNDVASASQTAINQSERYNTTTLVGAMTGSSGYDTVGYSVTRNAVCNGTLTYTSPVPTNAAVVSGPEGSWRVCVRLGDIAGNVTYGSSAVFTVDWTPPTFTSLPFAGATVSDGYINNLEQTSNNTVVVSPATPTGTSNYTIDDFAIVPSTTTCDSSVTYSMISAPNATNSGFATDGQYRVCVRLRDAAFNTTYGASGIITVKKALPSFTSIDRGADVSDGYLSMADRALTNPLATNLVGSNYDLAQYAVTDSATSCNVTPALSYGAMPLDNDASITTHNQAYKVCVKLSDLAGNPAVYGSTSNFTALLSGPTCTGVTLINDATDGYINSTEHASTNPLTTGVDSPSVSVTASKFKVIPSIATCDASQTFASGIPTSDDTALSVNGSYKICARVEDSAAQYGYCESSNFTAVNHTITFTSLDRVGPAADGYINPGEHATSVAVVGSLVGSNYDAANYALVSSTTTCDGNLTYGPSIPLANDSGIAVDGDAYKVCVELSDVAGNPKAYGSSATFVYDATPPVFNSVGLDGAASDGYLNISEHSLSSNIIGVVSGSGQALEEFAVVTASTTCGLPLTWSSAVPKANDAALASDDQYKVCVKLTDLAGNTDYGASPLLVFDSTAPVFTSVALANNASDTYINIADTGSALDVVDSLVASGQVSQKYKIALSTATCSSQVGYGVTVPVAGDFAGMNGDYKVCVELEDVAGNRAYGESSVVHVDTSTPTFTSLSLGSTVTDGYLSAADHAGTAALASSVVASGYDLAEYAVVTNATVCDATVTYGSMPQGNDISINVHTGAYKVCVKLTDVVGNPAAYGSSSPFVALLSAPTCASVDLANGASDGYISSTDHGQNLVVTSGVSAPSSTVASTAHSVIATTATCNSSQTFAAAVPMSDDSVFGVNGTYKVCASVTDAESQAGYCESSPITVVNQAISFTSIDRSGPASDGYINVSEHAVSTAIVSNLVGANYDSAKYVIVDAATACDGTVTYSSTVPKADSVDITVDGASYKVCVELSDVAGNPKAYGASATFLFDATAPVFTSFPLAFDATDGYINNSEHGLTSDVAGSLSVSGQSSVMYALVTNTSTCGFPLTWTSSIPKSNDALFSAQGGYKVCVQLSDTAGNTTYGSSPDVTFDSVAPSFTSISLANAAADTYLNAAESSGATAVVGSLVSSGESTILYKVAPAASNCASLSSYSAGVPNGSDFVGFNGDYKVCVQLFDLAGNQSFGASDTIHVDTVAPSFTLLALDGDATDSYINLAESSASNNLTSAAVGSGYDSISYVLVASASSCSGAAGWSGAIPKSNDPAFGAVGQYKVCAKLSDLAGNPDAFGASSDVTFDNVAPSFTSLSLAGNASDGYLNQSERSQSITILGALTASGYSSDTYKLVTSSTTCDAALSYGASVNADSSDIGADGNYKVCVKLADLAGNVSFGSSVTFAVDTSGPTFTSLALGVVVSDGYLSSTEHASTSSLGGALVSSGGSVYSYAVVNVSTTCDAAVSYAGMPLANDGSLVHGATYKLCAKVADSAGNAAYGASGSFVTDFMSPSISAVTLAAVVSDGYLNIEDQTAASAILTSATASNHDTLSYVVVTAATTCNSSLTYNGSAPNTNNAAMNADGSWKVCVKASDLAGNVDAFSGSATFSRDVTRPSSALTTSGSLNPDSTVGSTTVISGTGSDAATGVSSTVISIQEGTGSCFDQSASDFTAACPNWLSVSGTTSWTYTLDDSDLIKGQTYSVSTKATDLAGNEQTSLGSGSFSFTATEGNNLWNRDLSYDQGSGDDKALAGAVDSSGNLYVVGYHSSSDKNWLIKKFSRRGVEDTANWNKDVGDPGVDEIARSVAVDDSNNIYVVGSRWNGADWDWMIKKYSSAGVEDTSWDMLINSGNGNDEALGVTTDSSSNVYVVGYGRNLAGGSSGEDVWLRKFQSDGTLLCEQKLDDGAANLADRGTAVAVNSSSSKIYVTGYHTATGPDQRLFVKRLRMSDCAVEVSATGNSSGSADYASAIKLDSSGAVYVAGVTSSSDADWWIQKYTASLALTSEVNTVVSRQHAAQAIAIDSSNRVYVGGYNSSNGSVNGQNLWIRQFSNTLVENTSAWDKNFNGTGSAADQVTALVTTSGSIDADNLYVIGWSTNLVGGSSGADWWIKKLAGP